MALEEGQVWVCSDAECGCEVTVTESAHPGKGGPHPLRCCCGRDMRVAESVTEARPARKGAKKVGEIMTREVEFVDPKVTVRDAAGKMKSLGLGSMPVTEGGRLVGVVTDREITLGLAAEGKDPAKTAVREIMNTNPALMKEEDPVSAVPAIMENKSAHFVFAVDRDGKLAGIVSLGKVARADSEKRAGRIVKKLSRPRKKKVGA
jgi:CBS domain-containing protein